MHVGDHVTERNLSLAVLVLVAANKVYPSCPESRGSYSICLYLCISIPLSIQTYQSLLGLLIADRWHLKRATPPRNPSPKSFPPLSQMRCDCDEMRWRYDATTQDIELCVCLRQAHPQDYLVACPNKGRPCIQPTRLEPDQDRHAAQVN